ncbi:gas vesicle protein GvpM [Natrarchaeobaculum sulfurireducens]|uniref:Gas vesicle protein GvpM n=1 Tax=Natrarchaeobaculum sulfurireducens TaxID=2044521 RepID=A0A346PRI4_9EURY|nr:gas vesicle protein GvpJ [Natrarchaeobaculum sulfurireducens]AXR82129.1 Gas vesicle protein GvpM [Natrarchaeobaculum sulfurireducens]
MRPRKDEETLVDVLDVLLRDGAVLRADVVVSVADVPLIGIKLTAAIAGMETMTEYGLFEQWDVERRRSAITRQQHGPRDPAVDRNESMTVDGRSSD